MRKTLKKYFQKETDAAPLAVFRIFFGLMMLGSLIRFWAYGWIEKFYILPKMHFTYYGFDWVRPFGEYTYLLFFICALSTIGIIIGYKYRWSMVIFFLSFTYIELMDKTTYLNHYYFISLLSFLLIFLPAHTYYSIDALKNQKIRFQEIPQWSIDSVKLLLGIVYFYAGIAKINSDWLLNAMPLKIWLPSNYDWPILGSLFQEEWVAFAFSWSGMLYDIFIPFLLLFRKTRPWAFLAVLFFHIMTRMLFPIGMFPFIMIISTLIFFDARFHHRVLGQVSKILKINISVFNNGKSLKIKSKGGISIVRSMLMVFFFIQLLFPFRYLFYPGNLFWTEEGYRFSWRVMLMEKTGYAQFKVQNKTTGVNFYINNADFLSAFQEKQMSTQADFILQYAHFLETELNKGKNNDLAIYVESYAALNGSGSRAYIDPNVDLLSLKDNFKHKSWILPFNE